MEDPQEMRRCCICNLFAGDRHIERFVDLVTFRTCENNHRRHTCIAAFKHDAPSQLRGAKQSSKQLHSEERKAHDDDDKDNYERPDLIHCLSYIC